MIIVTIEMTVLPEKCLELKQTLMALSEPTRNKEGCLYHNVVQDIENENILSLIEAWESQTDLDDHLRSDEFNILLGTKSLLSISPDIAINTVSHSSGWEAVHAARAEH